MVHQRGGRVPLGRVDRGVGHDRVDERLERLLAGDEHRVRRAGDGRLGVVLRHAERRRGAHALPVLDVSEGRVLGQQGHRLDVGVGLVVEEGDGLEGLLDAALAREHDGGEPVFIGFFGGG